MTKPFLLLQVRPEDAAADNEAEAFLKAGGLDAHAVRRIRIEKTGMPKISVGDYAGIIVGGGPFNVSDKNKPQSQERFEHQLSELLKVIIELDFPYMGACYGLGILASTLGGEVSKYEYSEGVGAVTIRTTETGKSDPIFSDEPHEFRAFVGHKEACQNIPPQAVLLASSETCPVQMIRVKQNIYATQFHPELDSEGLALRIKTYRNAGYFPPEQADQLIELARKESVTVPEQLFKKFVEMNR